MNGPAPSHQIDVLKGLSIIAVIVIHGLAYEARFSSFSALHYWQAVPVFVFLMGLNGAGSLVRSGGTTLRSLYSQSYWIKRARRLGIPIGLAVIASALLGVITGKLNVGPLTLLGVFPLSGPGNYFITLTVEFTVLAPLLYFFVRRRPVATLVVIIAAELAIELVVGRLDSLSTGEQYMYNSALLRYGGICAAGMVLMLRPTLPRPSSAWIALPALSGAVYLLWFTLRDGDVPMFASYSGPTNALCAGYAVWLALLAMRHLPPGRFKTLSVLGRASFHIFLVQMLWFALFTEQGAVALAIALLASLLGGLGFERICRRVDRALPGSTRSAVRRADAAASR
jgi:peptidoglycan/LPS O-acetylase OafA/YrhL